MSVESQVQRSSLPLLIPLGQFAKNPGIKLGRPVYVLGSKEACRLRLQSSTVSSTHALLVQTRHITYVRDLCSRSGVFVNGQQIKEAVLHDGDLLAIGKFTFKYQGPKKNYDDEPPVAPATLQVAGADLPIPIDQRAIVIGRRPTSDIPLLEPSVSSAHAVIFAWEGKRFLRDLWARTGTYLNGKPIHEQEIHPGDVIRCGETDITYAPSLEEAAYSVIEGASDSIVNALPQVEEIDLGLAVVPAVSRIEDAPLDVIVAPQTPPRQQELLPLESEAIELAPAPISGHDTAHVPMSIQIPPTQAPAQGEATGESTGEMTSDASVMAQSSPPLSSENPLGLSIEPTAGDVDSDLPRRGWRSAIQEADAQIASSAAALAIEPIAESPPSEPITIEPPPPAATEPPTRIKIEPAAVIAPSAGVFATGTAPPQQSVENTIDDVLGLSESVAPPSPQPTRPPRAGQEIIESTQPTPESALDLPLSDEVTRDPVQTSPDLTDTTFGRNVDEFEGESLGPIIETVERNEPAAPALSITSTKASHPANDDSTLAPPPVDLALTTDASSIIPAEPPMLADIDLASHDLDTLVADASFAPIDIVADTDLPTDAINPAPTSDPAPIDTGAIEPAQIDSTQIDATQIDTAPIEVAPIETALIEGSIVDETIAPDAAPMLAESTPAQDASADQSVAIYSSAQIDPAATLEADDALPFTAIDTMQALDDSLADAPTDAIDLATEEASIIQSTPIEHSAPIESPVLHPLPSESLASINQAMQAQNLQSEVSLARDEIDSEPAPVSPDDTAMMVLAADAGAASEPVESQPADIQPPDEPPLVLEPLPISEVGATLSSAGVEEVNATIDASAAISTPDFIEPPIDAIGDAIDASEFHAPLEYSSNLEPVSADVPLIEQAAVELPVIDSIESSAGEQSADVSSFSGGDSIAIETGPFAIEPDAFAANTDLAAPIALPQVDDSTLHPFEVASPAPPDAQVIQDDPAHIGEPHVESVNETHLEPLAAPPASMSATIDHSAFQQQVVPAPAGSTDAVEQMDASAVTPTGWPEQQPAESLDLSKLQSTDDHAVPLDDSAAMGLLDESSPAADHSDSLSDHSDSIAASLTDTLAAHPSLDLSKLTPTDDLPTASHDAIAAESSNTDTPLAVTGELASQPPVDDLSPDVADDPVDLSFLMNSGKPLDEHTAADVLIDESATIDSTTLAGIAPEGAHVVIDHSAIEHLHLDHEAGSLETPVQHESISGDAVSGESIAGESIAGESISGESIAGESIAGESVPHDSLTGDTLTAASIPAGAMPEFPELLPASADDSIVGEMQITEQTQPVPPPMGGEAPLKIQPSPAIRPRRAKKPRVIRNAFGQDPSAPHPGIVQIPPFSKTAPGLAAEVTLTGLSQPSVREADVFSEIPRGEIDQAAAANTAELFTQPATTDGDIFAKEVAKSLPRSSLTGLADETADAPALPFAMQAKRARPRAMRPGMPMIGPRPPVAFADEEALRAAGERRRKLVRLAPILMVAMILLIAGAWAGIWYLVPVRTKIQTSVNFRNFAAQIQRDQRMFQADQANRLNQEATRNTAVHMLQDLHPQTTPGFLLNPAQFASLETFWPDVPVGQLVIRYDSTDPAKDKDRLEAVAMAVYDSNSQLAEQARTIKTQKDNLEKLTKAAADKIDALNKQIDGERELIDQAPREDQIAKLTAADKDLEAKYNNAISQSKDAQADLERLKKEQEKASAAAAADPTAADGEIQKMSKDAEALSARLAEARNTRVQMAAAARATLDAAYDEFKKQVDTVQGVAKDNPQMAAYVGAAQNLQSAIRDLTDQYIQHQQQDYTALNTLKSNFEAKMTDRKATLLANDPKLKEWSDQKEILTRKHNEAINSGLDQEASDLANQLKLADTAMKARQEIVANDPVYNEMITGLQQLIDQKQQSINEERKKTDQKLAELRQSFNKSAAGVSTMPADQQQLAAAMRDRLAAIDAARKQYAEAADASAADADINIKRMNQDLQTLQTNIEARKKQLAAANSPELRKAAEDQRQAELAKKTLEVANLNMALADARTAYEANHTNLLKATAAAEQAALAATRMENDIQARLTLVSQKEQNDRELALKVEQAKRAVEPVEPTAADVRIVGDPIDNRAKIGLGASAAIFIFFAGCILMTLRGAARESHYIYSPPIEPLETPTTKVETDAEENAAAVA